MARSKTTTNPENATEVISRNLNPKDNQCPKGVDPKFLKNMHFAKKRLKQTQVNPKVYHAQSSST
ncbi:hypothetical protein A6R68_11683, partial [Neotoma lepida]